MKVENEMKWTWYKKTKIEKADEYNGMKKRKEKKKKEGRDEERKITTWSKQEEWGRGEKVLLKTFISQQV